MRYLCALAMVLPAAALAHEGAHQHPHGIEYGWIAACLIGAGAAVVFLLRGRR